MKIYMLYGLVGTVLGALQMAVLFVLGLHGDKIHLLNDWKVSAPLALLGFAINIVVIVLGLRAWREAAPGGGMGYGRGVGGGCLIGLWQGLGTMVFMMLYGYVINPGFKAAMLANQVDQMREKGLPENAIAGAEKVMGFMLDPTVQGAMGVPMTALFALLVSLIAAAVLKREPVASVPPAL